ncbi:hypothetical protein FQA39_LY15946 [Lamprigera yunnana]|nr:hypothetical protein FQA39_LY15946 [Lamprigera yunnana]
MKILLCLFAVFAAQMHAKPAHKDLKAEFECLTEMGMKLEQVMDAVHFVTDPADDKEGVGEYLYCVWKKKEIMDNKQYINGEKIADYLLGIYSSYSLSQEQIQIVKDEANKCAQLSAKKDSTLAILVKNCILLAGKQVFAKSN